MGTCMLTGGAQKRVWSEVDMIVTTCVFDKKKWCTWLAVSVRKLSKESRKEVAEIKLFKLWLNFRKNPVNHDPLHKELLRHPYNTIAPVPSSDNHLLLHLKVVAM